MKILLAATILSTNVLAQSADLPCWRDPNLEVSPSTSQLAVLRSYLLPIDLDQPAQDLQVRIQHGDLRFLGIGGFVLGFPGLENRELICEHGFRYIQGTTDGLDSPEHGRLVHQFEQYATEYNSLLEAHVSGQ